MTKRELSQLYFLNREIIMQKQKLNELENAAIKTTSFISGIPGKSINNDKVAEYASKIADLKNEILQNLQKYIDEIDKLTAFIESIDDSFMRQILTLRYINRLSWQQISNRMGNNYTGDYLRITHNRFLNRT